MYDLGIKTTFIHFRANGMTIKKIAEVMGINRTTLIQWNKELYADIKIIENDEYEQIFQDCLCSKINRVRILAMELGESYENLDKGKYTNKLALLREIEKLTRLINIETGNGKYSSMMEKSEKTVDKDFPVILNDTVKFKTYDNMFDRENEYFEDWDGDKTNIYTEEDRKEALEKHQEEYDEKYKDEIAEELNAELSEEEIAADAKAIEEAHEKFKKLEEEELKNESDENCVKNSAGMKRSNRILNKVLNNKKVKRESINKVKVC